MPINLYLARHGNTFEANQTPVIVGKKTDLPLVEKGREQAELLAEYFKSKNIKFETIFSGKLKRQSEFAQIIAKKLNLSVTTTEALDELDYGQWEGLAPSQLEHKYESWCKKGIWPDVFLESETERTEILLNWLNCLRTQFDQDHNILAVSSNGIIKLFAKFSDISCGETIWSRLADASSIEQLKVSTGAFCELQLSSLGLNIDLNRWNIKPR